MFIFVLENVFLGENPSLKRLTECKVIRLGNMLKRLMHKLFLTR